MTLGWTDWLAAHLRSRTMNAAVRMGEDREQVRNERLAAEREWLEERRWCRCGALAKPGSRYLGEQVCGRCRSPWRRPVVVKQERSEPKRVHYCHEAGGMNRRGGKCWLASEPGVRCFLHRGED